MRHLKMNFDLDEIGAIVCRIGKIADIGPDEDFYNAGFSSINALELLLELESAYDVSIPDDQFIDVRSLRALQTLITHLGQEQVA
jgi:acyl carrier protein